MLVEGNPDKVTDQSVTELILKNFGLVIPKRTVQVVLQRLAKQRLIKKTAGVYRIAGNLPESDIVQRRQKAEQHINAVVTDFIEFSKTSYKSTQSFNSAITSICAFLSKFDITCLRAYMQGTVIPPLDGSHEVKIVLVSKYIIHIQQRNPERF